MPLIGLCSSWRPVKPSSQNKRGGRREVQFLHNPLRPVRLSVQDTSLSSWKGGFDSRTGHSWPSGVIGKHATLRMSCLHGVGVRVSPWSLNLTQASQCSAEFHKLSPSGATPEPATYGRVRKLAKRRGREPRVCEFDSPSGHSIDPVVQQLRRLDDTQERDGSTPSGIILKMTRPNATAAQGAD